MNELPLEISERERLNNTRYRDPEKEFPPFTKTVILCWCIDGACNVIVLFGLYQRNISILATAFYVALSRAVWAIGIGCIVIVCCVKHGAGGGSGNSKIVIVNQFLSFKSWAPLSRLTYCAYLVHPFIISSIGLNAETAVHTDILPAIIGCLGTITISFICAYALAVMSEIPYILLARMFFVSRIKTG